MVGGGRYRPAKGVATEFWLGVGFIGTQTHLTPNLISHPISATFFENFGKCKKYTLQNILKDPNFWGAIPATPSPVGDAPASDPPSQMGHGLNLFPREYEVSA